MSDPFDTQHVPPVPPAQPYSPPPAYGYAPPYPQAYPPVAPQGYPQNYPTHPPQYPPQYPPNYPPGWDPWGGPPPHRSRTGLIALLVVAALAVAGAVALVVDAATQNSTSGSHARIAAPPSIGRYGLLTGPSADRVQSMMHDMVKGSSAASFFNYATIAAYAADSGDTPQLIAIMIPSDGAPAGSTGQDAVDEMLAILPSTQPSDPGPHGGVQSCGQTNFGAVDESACGWSDSSTTGMIVSVNPAEAPASLGDIARQLRALID